ncbi:hypothetical protein R75461_07800 [Paraburkholderia nemoris]|uniref:hypothetical protein n=1 Tax=Paraburkholderia nemoris TaxID=2793076 RepID=UPI00190B8A3D|nr:MULTISPECIES: hypothetical protein [Paraburkholderia]MBK3786500.1 hypothetical protein [Paraburkholderia aspalathi]CAE6857567.1 hypothetical protein R75461_07800 [Paraburkholderia nemoris]
MDSNQQPPPMPVPFALNGAKNAIPQASQISVTPGAASFNDGFPPLTMTDPLAGGIPPFGRDMNGILYLISQTTWWKQAGGSFVYNAQFANDPNVGGYPAGAMLLRADLASFWFNLAEHNTTSPDVTDGSSQGWVALNADWNASAGPGLILNKPELAKVATSGSYVDLSDTPAVPAPQVNADWDANSGVAQILNRPNVNPGDNSLAADASGLRVQGEIVPITATNAVIPDDCNGKVFKVIDPAVNALPLPWNANVGAGRQFRIINMAAPQLVLRATAPDMLDDVTFTNRAIGSVMIPQGSVATVSYGDTNITVQSQLGVGVQPWDLVQLDANGRLPRVDGSQLTGIDGTLIAVTVYSVVAQTVSFATVPQSISCTVGLPLAGSPVAFTTTGALPPELVAGTTYYVVSPSQVNSQFRVSATRNGAPIAVSSVGTGTHSIANPPWLKATSNPALVDFELQGGGGAGGLGGPSNGSGTATGGGAGGYARLRRPASALPDSLGITIGAGGLPPSATGYSNPGGTTSLGTLASATGGGGGYGYSNNQLILGTPGGTAVGGDLIIDGQGSAPVIVTSPQTATSGGSSMFGFGGMGWAYLGGSTPKTDATGRGAGGAGGNATSSGGFGVGRGTDGLIIAREYA